MKKVLFATTALIATAGVASADIALSGSGNMGLKRTENSTAADEVNNHSEFAFTITASTVTDSGLTFSASTTQLTSNNGTTANDGTTVSVAGAFGKVSFGSVAEADEIAALGDLGFDGIGMDDPAEAYSGDSLSGATTGHDFAWAYSVNGLDIQVSTRFGETTATADDANEASALGLKYTINNVYVGLGYSDVNDHTGSDAGDGNTTTVYAGGTFGALTVATMFSSHDSELATQADRNAKGVNIAYDMGDGLTLRAAYADNDTNTSDSSGLGFSYNMGGGVTLAGAMGSANDVSVADIGFNLSF